MTPEERYRESFRLHTLAMRQYDQDGDAVAMVEGALAAHRAGPGISWIFDPSNDATIARIHREVLVALLPVSSAGLASLCEVEAPKED